MFAQGTPLEGINKGRAYHGIDIVFSFQNFPSEFPTEGGCVELAKRMTTAWITYAYGESPWTPYNNGGTLKVWDLGDKEREMAHRDVDPGEWKPWVVMERIGLDEIWEVGRTMLDSGPRGGE